MKTFDLEAALIGEKVVTKDGREVKEIKLFEYANNSACVACVITGNIHIYDKSGNANTNMLSSMEYILSTMEYNEELKLFMAKVKKKGWINIYKNDSYKVGDDIFETKEKAIESDSYLDDHCITTIEIEWEE